MGISGKIAASCLPKFAQWAESFR